jgi:hypothetical protein
MLAVTRLENVLCGNGYPVPNNASAYYRTGLVPGYEPGPHTTTQGWNPTT